MVTYMADGGPGNEPVQAEASTSRGRLTHGHLPENNNHGGGPTGAPGPAHAAGRHRRTRAFVDLVDFQYQLGDLSLGGPAGNPPVIQPGPVADLPRRRRRREGDLPLDHLVQGALQPLDRHRVSDRGRRRAVRVGHARQRGAAGDRLRSSGQTPTNLSAGHVHVLLPDPSVHARRLPGQAVVALYAPVMSEQSRKAVRRRGGGRQGARRAGGCRAERGRAARGGRARRSRPSWRARRRWPSGSRAAPTRSRSRSRRSPTACARSSRR